MSGTEKQMLTALLRERKHLLDSMFLGTPAEAARLKEVNDRLYDLTQRLYAKTYDLYTACLRTGYDPEFDDDIMFEGTLFFDVDGWEDEDGHSSVFKMAEDSLYGSDFAQMLGLITSLQGKDTSFSCAHTLISYDPHHKPEMTAEELHLNNTLDDGVSWDHGKRFPEICLCHAAYSLLSDNLFSWPDLLRMNDFWCEVKVTHQLLTDLSGRRYSYICSH